MVNFPGIAKSWKDNHSEENARKVFHVCFGNFELEEDWQKNLGKLISQEINVVCLFPPQSKKTAGRPNESFVDALCSNAKNELVKKVMRAGKNAHGWHVSKINLRRARDPGVFYRTMLRRAQDKEGEELQESGEQVEEEACHFDEIFGHETDKQKLARKEDHIHRLKSVSFSSLFFVLILLTCF